ncbi:MAG: NirA family protein [Pseudomonadota bacterium]
MSGQDFSDEQKRYLEGFVSGVQSSRAAAGLKPLGGGGADGGSGEPAGPDAEHLKAMAAQEAAGGKLVNEEKAKREDHPFDAYPRLRADALAGNFPKGVDNFRWRFHGLYYVAPTQDAFMCRMRIPGGILKAWQFAGIADLADQHGGGYAHVTTRANLQIREIPAAEGPKLIEALTDIGVNPKGSGADNIRNVTGAATAGIDPQELLDTRPYAKAWHHHIMNTRVLYGLPRKFNVSFDGGGLIPTLEETNDIAFTAVKVADPTAETGEVLFRLGLGGITGHCDFARPTGAYVKPDEATEVADAIVHVFIQHGIRTDRKKARLKYVLDDWGFEKFLAEVEQHLDRKLLRLADEQLIPAQPTDRQAHIGVHPQKQDGLVWVGVTTLVGHLTTDQMRSLSEMATEFGDGDIRLTVWQNLIISGVKSTDVETFEKRLNEIGLTSKANAVRAGLVACTGNTGCKFAASNTKGTAAKIADHLDTRIEMDQPVNIHLTGCHHSCAQHYIGDIGMIACRVPEAPDSDDTVEGFHVLLGGGFGSDPKIARELYPDTRVEDCPRLIEKILKTYLSHRENADETFFAFADRHHTDALKTLIDSQETAQ